MFHLEMLHISSTFITGLYILNFILAFTIIFLERKDPSATLAWLMILFLIPGVGILLYFFFSQNISRQKIFRLTKFEEASISNALYEQMSEIKNGTFTFSKPETKKWLDLIRLNQTYSGAYFTQNNRVTLLTDGAHKFDMLLEDIKNASLSINVCYYIIKYDSLGRTLLDALTEKAREGVEVRLLMDGIGSRQITQSRLEKFRKAGGRAEFFFPPVFKYFTMKLNYRNHRKLVVIDNEIGYIGGFNVGNEYIGKKKKFGYWRDTHIRVTGDGLEDINARFILDWRFASGEKLAIPHSFYPVSDTPGSTGMQVISCGPDSPKVEIELAYLKMITNAKKNIYIQTPYFVPSKTILNALRVAAHSGVDVRIMIPCMPDHMFVYWATFSYVGVLLNAGAKIYVYDNGFLHAKTLCVDGEVVSIGSANFDIRSFKLNFEANAVLFDTEEAYKMEAIFEADMTKSHELTKQLYRNRSKLIRFKESVARLLSDLL